MDSVWPLAVFAALSSCMAQDTTNDGPQIQFHDIGDTGIEPTVAPSERESVSNTPSKNAEEPRLEPKSSGKQTETAHDQTKTKSEETGPSDGEVSPNEPAKATALEPEPNPEDPEPTPEEPKATSQQPEPKEPEPKEPEPQEPETSEEGGFAYYGFDKRRGANDPVYAQYGGDVYFVASSGKDNASPSADGRPDGDGSIERPWATLNQALKQASYGDTVFMRGGVYRDRFSNVGWYTGTRHGAGSATRRIVLRSYPGEWAVIDGSSVQDTIFRFYYERWAHLQNFEVRNSSGAGLALIGTTDSILENIYSHSNHGSGFGGGAQKNNSYRFCTAYNNFDEHSSRPGDGADGYSIGKSEVPSGPNHYYRCVADYNSDDGWDVWEAVGNVFEECVASNNGRGSHGNGDGFKGGGRGREGGPSGGSNVYTNCIAYGNRSEGFSTNSGQYHEGGNTYLNNTAFNNAKGFWAYRSSVDSSGQIHFLRNNVSFANRAPDVIAAGMDNANNSWNLDLGLTDSAFQSVDPADLGADFLRPTPSSKLLDRGTPVGLSFAGNGPDLGALEADDVCDNCKPLTPVEPVSVVTIGPSVPIPVPPPTIPGSILETICAPT